MADLNDLNRPVITDLYADVIDTLRENTKRVSTNSLPVTGGTVSGTVSAPNFVIQPGGYAVWHAGNFSPSSYMPIAGGTFGGPVTLAGNATASLQPVTLQQMNGQGFVREAPQDGVYYGRRNAGWEAVASRTVDDALIGILALRPVRGGAPIGNWLELSGQVASKTQYARLWAWAAANGMFAANDSVWSSGSFGMFVDLGGIFRVPFCAGAFLRTIDPSGAWYDQGRPAGVLQGSAIESHYHTGVTGGERQGHVHGFQGTDVVAQTAAIFPAPGGAFPVRVGSTAISQTDGENAAHDHAFNTDYTGTGNETHPPNLAYRGFIYAGNPLA